MNKLCPKCAENVEIVALTDLVYTWEEVYAVGSGFRELEKTSWHKQCFIEHYLKTKTQVPITESESKERFVLPDDIAPGYVPSPGEVIRDELKARGWSQRDLANMMVRPIQIINDIINAKTEITPETAIGLGIAFDTSASFWLNLEKEYRLWLEKQKSEPCDE